MAWTKNRSSRHRVKTMNVRTSLPTLLPMAVLLLVSTPAATAPDKASQQPETATEQTMDKSPAQPNAGNGNVTNSYGPALTGKVDTTPENTEPETGKATSPDATMSIEETHATPVNTETEAKNTAGPDAAMPPGKADASSDEADVMVQDNADRPEGSAEPATWLDILGEAVVFMAKMAAVLTAVFGLLFIHFSIQQKRELEERDKIRAIKARLNRTA